MKLAAFLTMCITTAGMHLYSDHGSLKSQQLHPYVEVHVKANSYLHLKALGDNKGGDLDCYLLGKGPHGWGIVARDEGDADSCELGYYSSMDDTIRVWYANHGSQTDSYTLTVDEKPSK